MSVRWVYGLRFNMKYYMGICGRKRTLLRVASTKWPRTAIQDIRAYSLWPLNEARWGGRALYGGRVTTRLRLCCGHQNEIDFQDMLKVPIKKHSRYRWIENMKIYTYMYIYVICIFMLYVYIYIYVHNCIEIFILINRNMHMYVYLF